MKSMEDKLRNKAQTSIEFLLISACLVSLFLFLVPSINEVKNAALSEVILKQEEALLYSISDSIKESYSFGKGSCIKREVFAPIETKVWGEGKKVFIQFNHRGKKRNLSKNTGIESIINISLLKGRYTISSCGEKGFVIIKLIS